MSTYAPGEPLLRATPELLREGSPSQRQAHALLAEHRILEHLQGFTPTLAGTIPLGIDTPTSDLDILCAWRDKGQFVAALRQHFRHHPDFAMVFVEKCGFDTVIARFELGGRQVEVFGQDRPVEQQEAFRHMRVEHAILQRMGPKFMRSVQTLKGKGLRTEPAFALLLGIKGDPYQALLQMDPDHSPHAPAGG